jgi:hypothetical protein
MAEALPFLIPIAVFFIVGLIARVATLREGQRLLRQRDGQEK